MFWTKDKKQIKSEGFTVEVEEETIRKQTSKENISMIAIIAGWILWILAYIFFLRPYILYLWFDKLGIQIYYAIVDFVLILFIGFFGTGIIAWTWELLKRGKIKGHNTNLRKT